MPLIITVLFTEVSLYTIGGTWLLFHEPICSMSKVIFTSFYSLTLLQPRGMGFPHPLETKSYGALWTAGINRGPPCMGSSQYHLFQGITYTFLSSNHLVGILWGFHLQIMPLHIFNKCILFYFIEFWATPGRWYLGFKPGYSWVTPDKLRGQYGVPGMNSGSVYAKKAPYLLYSDPPFLH